MDIAWGDDTVTRAFPHNCSIPSLMHTYKSSGEKKVEVGFFDVVNNYPCGEWQTRTVTITGNCRVWKEIGTYRTPGWWGRQPFTAGFAQCQLFVAYVQWLSVCLICCPRCSLVSVFELAIERPCKLDLSPWALAYSRPHEVSLQGSGAGRFSN